MERGTVLWFNKVNGFIRTDKGAEVYFKWIDIETLDEKGFKNVFSGDRVEFDIVDASPEKDLSQIKASCITILPRVSGRGKYLLRVAYVKQLTNLCVDYLHLHIFSKKNSGLRYVNIGSTYIIGTDIKLSEFDVASLELIIAGRSRVDRGICETANTFPYDIFFC